MTDGLAKVSWEVRVASSAALADGGFGATYPALHRRVARTYARSETACLRDFEPARRAACRPDYTLPCRADLSDHLVCFLRCRSRRRLVQSGARRPHLHTHFQSDDGRAEERLAALEDGVG